MIHCVKTFGFDSGELGELVSVEGALISSIVFHPQGPQSYRWLAGGAMRGLSLPTDPRRPKGEHACERCLPIERRVCGVPPHEHVLPSLEVTIDIETILVA